MRSRPLLLLASLPVLVAFVLVRPGVAKPGERRGMVVVAPERFHKALGAYVLYRNEQRPTQLASLEAILKEEHGADDPERLKRWLYRAWRERDAGYALLVGDADVLPVRFMVLDRVTPAAFDYAFYPSDLYYADVAHRNGTFDDWNARRDGFHAHYFGEVRGEKNKTDPINFDHIDYRPELAVGRWPVNSVDEVRMVAEKTMAHERALISGKAPGYRKAAFVAVPGWVDAHGMMDGWIARLPHGWTPVRLYGGPGTTKKAPPDEHHVTMLLNEGVSLVFHTGHGYDNGWAESFGVGALKRLRNHDRLPVILSAGCSTARFGNLPPYEAYEDVSGGRHRGTNEGEVFKAPPPAPSPYCRGAFRHTGLGERLVRGGPNGAVAYIGCNTGSQPCGLTLLDGFVTALAQSHEPTLGECWTHAVAHYYDAEHLETIKPNNDWYPPSIFFQAMKFMVFGDPALRLTGPAK